MNIELNDYGFCLDTSFCYIALSWGLIVTAAFVIVGIKLWRKSHK